MSDPLKPYSRARTALVHNGGHFVVGALALTPVVLPTAPQFTGPIEIVWRDEDRPDPERPLLELFHEPFPVLVSGEYNDFARRPQVYAGVTWPPEFDTTANTTIRLAVE